MPVSKESEKLCNGILVASAMLAIVIATILSASALSGDGAMICSMMLLVFWFIGALLLMRKPLVASVYETFCVMIGLYLCLCLRLCLFDYMSGDYVSFLSQWISQMKNMSVNEALITSIGDYNLPYLYLLLIVSRIPLYELYSIKLISVFADMFLAIVIGRITALFVKQDKYVVIAFLGALLAPTFFLNSGYWGQCDSIYAALALWGLYWGIKNRPCLSMVMFALSFSFKLQAIFLFPIIAFLLVRKKIQLRHMPILPITFLCAMLPALLAGRSITSTFSIYLTQMDSYPYLSLNAPSFWVLIPNDYFDNLNPAPVLLAGICTLLFMTMLLPKYPYISDGQVIDISLIFSLMIPWLLPRMHERYFYVAEVLSLLYVARHPRRLPIAVVLLSGGFLSYCVYLFGGMQILSMASIAAAYGLTLGYLIFKLYLDIQNHNNEGSTDKEQGFEQESIIATDL